MSTGLPLPRQRSHEPGCPRVLLCVPATRSSAAGVRVGAESALSCRRHAP